MFKKGKSFVDTLEIIFIGIGLSMDAFAVSICKGLAIKKITWKQPLKIASFFGLFQAIMPLLGYFLGTTFQHLVSTISHWIAFILLTFIGINMIKESATAKNKISYNALNIKDLIMLSLATSLDALAVGITFSFFHSSILLASLIIGAITFIICTIGVLIGNKFGNHFQNSAEIIGGIILIVIGLKILFDHFKIISI